MTPIATLVDQLFAIHRRPDGREYTHMEVCVALQGAIEPSHLSKLRNGKITNPGRDTLLALCRFFNVPPSYFFPELRAPVSEALGSSEESLQVALRSTGLNPDVEIKILELIRALQHQQDT